MNIFKKFSSPLLILSLVIAGSFTLSPTKANAAANISAAHGGNITSANTIQVYFNNPGHDLASVDFSKFHIDVNGGGVDPLNPVSAVIHTAGNPWIITLTFAGTPFANTATAYDASHGMYIDALAVTDTNGDTNEVVGHADSLQIFDDQNPVFVSAETTSLTNVRITFSEPVTVVTPVGFDISIDGNFPTNVAVNSDNASQIDLTIINNNPNYFSDGGLYISPDSVRDVSPYANSNILTQNIDVDDGIAPETPTVGPVAGVRVNALPQTTTLSSVGSQSIRYTTDGSTPNCSTGLITNPFTVTADMTIKVIGCDNQGNSSSVETFNYVFVTHTGGGGSSPVIVPTAQTLTITPISTTGSEIIVPISITIGTQIPGCGNRTTGFSSATGQSCIGNVVTSSSSPSYAYNFGNAILKNGSKGEAVKELQKFLNQILNLGLVVDGHLGPKTIAVIKQWQKDNGLVSDGLVGPKTKAQMNASVQ